ncbi:MAG: tRNA pseudouridine(38-40) synthase TruA [Bacteroidetes bacterium]|nr:tRNA pseudouridine(38-40) synthase TruA [Bacteroidota bacterium]NCQ10700.1 tRNA pseudouridine(38-40) synthase TruA [Bacteroidota bacterium]
MNRYFLFIEYLGTNFNGWQSQPDQKTIQDEIERVLRIITGKKDLKIVGSGRTDSGVHASNQVAHLYIETELDTHKFKYQANSLMKSGISIWDIKKVKPEIHARFAATSRAYKYTIITRPSPLREQSAWFYNAEIDLKKLQACANLLTTVTDYSTFSKENPGNIGSEFCTIERAEWEKVKEDEFVFYIKSNRFLRHMVRYLVGSMLKVGKGELSIQEFEKALRGENENYVHLKAPANGLCLIEVNYPNEVFLTD